MRFWLLPFCVLCVMLCPCKLLLLLLWFLLLLFVALMQVFRAVSMPVVLLESAQMLQPAMPCALLRVELLSVRLWTLGHLVLCRALSSKAPLFHQTTLEMICAYPTPLSPHPLSI